MSERNKTHNKSRTVQNDPVPGNGHNKCLHIGFGDLVVGRVSSASQ